MAIDSVDDLDFPQNLIVERVGALALGLTPEGYFPDNLDIYDLDEFLSDAIDPALN